MTFLGFVYDQLGQYHFPHNNVPAKRWNVCYVKSFDTDQLLFTIVLAAAILGVIVYRFII